MAAPTSSVDPPDAPAHGSSRARHALGRRLLAEGGVLWSALPIEWGREGESGAAEAARELPGLLWRVWASLAVLLRRPRASFAHVHEPVAHGAVLQLLHAVRLPLWIVLVAVLGAQTLLAGDPEAIVLRPVHEVLDPRLAEILSLWLLLMVPIGVPLLYFTLGMATHVALTLSGGAPRSIAASMRAAGYALAPTLLGVAALDLPLHLGLVPGAVYLGIVGALALLYFFQLGMALTGTHAISPIRGFVVAVVPVAMVLAVQLGRAVLVLPDIPGWAPDPGHPFFIP